MALSLGFGSFQAVQLATAVSEIATNQVRHAGGTGLVRMSETYRDGVAGIEVHATDEGPGIPDIEQALVDGFSTAGSLGVGLAGARRLVDDFAVKSVPGQGTTVRLVKWAGPLGRPLTTAQIAEWSASGDHGSLSTVVRPLPNGLLLAIADRTAAASLHDSPLALLERQRPTSTFAAAWLSGLDGRVTWLRNGPASGTLLRRRADRYVSVAGAPRLSGATITVMRGDVLLLAGAVEAPVPADPSASVEEITESLAGPSRPIVAARLARGAFERAHRPG
jgi:serine/threonine-protein kinase RsbT